jgi:hypothetical protein
MAQSGVFAVLKIESPYRAVFPGGRVPIVPFGFECDSPQESPLYILDVNRCTEEQIGSLAAVVAKTEGGTAEQVRGFLETQRRYPIGATQVKMVVFGKAREVVS